MKLKSLRLPIIIISSAVALVLLGIALVFIFGGLKPGSPDTTPPTTEARLSGWQTIDGVTYYFDPATGDKSTGWLELPEGKYFLDENGTPVIGLYTCDGDGYYFDDQGHMVAGWVDKRYFANDGKMAVGLLELDGNHYYFDENGLICTGLVDTADGKRYFNEDGTMFVGFLEIDGNRHYFAPDGIMCIGWLNLEDQRLYFDENGILITAPGWLHTPEGTWYLKEDGQPYTGWMQTDEARYYFMEDGAMAVGSVMVDEVQRYFSSDGNYVPLINPWNKVPDDFKLNLVTLEGHKVDATCYEELKAMITAARDAGLTCVLDSTYRNISLQTDLWDWRYNYYLNEGYSDEEAYRLTARRVAYPGTSEHHTGLAMDIVEVVKDGTLYAWFREHAWEYGFIVRYVGDKEPLTGIKDEPWHLRYVGKEIAQTLQETGWCLEEFMSQSAEGDAA